jgi:hypothetical protein
MRDTPEVWDTKRLWLQPGLPTVVGVGFVAAPGEARPLIVLVGVDSTGEQANNYGPESLESRVESFLGRLQPLSSQPPALVEAILTAIPHSIDVPEPLVLWVSTIEPLAAAPGDRVRCPTARVRGSLGFPTRRAGSTTVDGFLTAGHVTPGGVGGGVDLETMNQHGPPTYSRIGTVIRHADPIGLGGAGGWDYALVEVDPGVNPPSPLTSNVASLSPTLPSPLPVTMHGAVSGLQMGGIVGALTVLGVPTPPAPPATSRLWRDCWIMIPSAIGQQGDSGAAVLDTSSGEGVGMLVGGSRQLPAVTYAVQYVQDLENLTASELTPANISIM